jgi:hypothetical protein
MAVRHPYHSLENVLIVSELAVDGELDDGWAAASRSRAARWRAAVRVSSGEPH